MAKTNLNEIVGKIPPVQYHTIWVDNSTLVFAVTYYDKFHSDLSVLPVTYQEQDMTRHLAKKCTRHPLDLSTRSKDESSQ
jgi:hypothetical protein